MYWNYASRQLAGPDRELPFDAKAIAGPGSKFREASCPERKQNKAKMFTLSEAYVGVSKVLEKLWLDDASASENLYLPEGMYVCAGNLGSLTTSEQEVAARVLAASPSR